MAAWLRIRRNNHPSRPLTISIPKRVMRLSTRRSRIRRLIREAVRLEASEITRCGDLVFSVQQTPTGRPGLSEVREVLRKFLRDSS